jgi:3-oxoacyl-[acyl-carrier-protein] synthase II
MISRQRVVITGLGLVSPLGIGVEASWRMALEGKSGIGPITQFDASSLPARIAGEVKDFDPALYVEAKEIKKMDRFIHFAMASATMAMQDSKLTINDDNAERVGVIIGSGIGGLQSIEHYTGCL